MSKVTIITGGTSGIGRGIAEKILENSASDDILYVSYGHNTEQAEEFLHAQTEENQKKIRLLQADMSSYDEMMKFVSRTVISRFAIKTTHVCICMALTLSP